MKQIGPDAFYECKSLRSIAIPKEVRRIRAGTFQGCEALVRVTLPEALTHIEDQAFSGIAVKRIALPATLKVLGWRAFSHCYSLKKITLPGGLVSLGHEAFFRCTKLMSATLPGGLTRLGLGIFDGCGTGEGAPTLDDIFETGDKTEPTPAFSICAPAGSAAERYAKAHGIPFTPKGK